MFKFNKIFYFIFCTFVISCAAVIGDQKNKKVAKAEIITTDQNLKNDQIEIRKDRKISITSIDQYFLKIMGGTAAKALDENRLSDAKHEFEKIAANIMDPEINKRARFMAVYLAYYTGDPTTSLTKMPALADELPLLSDVAYEIAALSAVKIKEYKLAVTYANRIKSDSCQKSMIIANSYFADKSFDNALSSYEQVVSRWAGCESIVEAKSKIITSVCAIDKDKPLTPQNVNKEKSVQKKNGESSQSEHVPPGPSAAPPDEGTDKDPPGNLEADHKDESKIDFEADDTLDTTETSNGDPVYDRAKMAVQILNYLKASYPSNYWTKEANKCSNDLYKRLGIERKSEKHESAASQKLFDKAHGFMVKKHYSSAAKFYRRAIKLSHKNGKLQCSARYENALVVSFLRDHEKAAALFSEIANDCSYPYYKIRSLYRSGKEFISSGMYTEAIEMFQKVEELFPEHSYADDARLHSAKAYLKLGDKETFMNMISSLSVDYPKGDMRSEALWMGSKLAMDGGDLKRAEDLLSTYYNIFPIEEDWYTAGRSGYWLGRVEQLLGKNDEALSHFEYVISTAPFSYYMLLSYSRMYEIDKNRADFLIDELLPKNESNYSQISTELLNKSSDFALGVELVRLGLTTRGKKIIKNLLMKPDSKPEIHRAAAAIFRNMGQYSSSKELTSLSKKEWDRRYPTGSDYEIWTLAYPEAFDEIVKNEAASQKIDPSLIFAIMREESGFNEKIESWANATGLMQLILPTAKAMGKRVGLNKIFKRDLKKPEINIKLGTAYLSYLDNMFSNPALVIAGYNAGEGAVLKWKKERADMELDLFIENIPYSQTRGYTKRVLSTYGIYNFLYKEFHPVIKLNLSINSQ